MLNSLMSEHKSYIFIDEIIKMSAQFGNSAYEN